MYRFSLRLEIRERLASMVGLPELEMRDWSIVLPLWELSKPMTRGLKKTSAAHNCVGGFGLECPAFSAG